MEIRQIVKSPETCERCRYSDELCDVRSCSSCPQHIAAPTVWYLCRCDTVKEGTPCKYFKEARS